MIGAYSEVRGGRVAFSGSVFLVGADPVFDAGSGRFQLTDYQVVAAQLSGTAGWGRPNRQLRSRHRGGGRGGALLRQAHHLRPADPGQRRRRPDPGDRPGGCLADYPAGPDLAPGLLGRPRIDLGVLVRSSTTPNRLTLDSLHTCTRVLADPGCTAAKPVCDHLDPGFTLATNGVGDSGSGSTRCNPGAGGTVTGRNVPAICQHVMSPDHLPAECGRRE